MDHVLPGALGRRLPLTVRGPVTLESADAGLVARARGGDRAAFGELYRRYARMVHGVLLARVPRPHVDDLVQDVFVTALDRLAGLRDPAAFGGWLAAIARHRAVDHLRSARKTVELSEEIEAPGSAHAETLEVLALLRALPEAYRETLTLRLVEGMSGPEIAARTGLTEGSVRVNLHRGMQLVKERLAAGERHER